MKNLLEEVPDVGDKIEILRPDGMWQKVEFVTPYTIEEENGVRVSIFTLMWSGIRKWRYIEGVDLSAVDKLPDKNDESSSSFILLSTTTPELAKFLSQFGIVLHGSAGSMKFSCRQEIAPYIVQQIDLLGLGWDVEEVKNESE